MADHISCVILKTAGWVGHKGNWKAFGGGWGRLGFGSCGDGEEIRGGFPRC